MITKKQMRERFPRWYEMTCLWEDIPPQELIDDGDFFSTPSGLRFDYRTAWLKATSPDPEEQEKWNQLLCHWNRATVMNSRN